MVADGELGAMDPDREAAGAGIEIIPGQRPLAALVEPPVAVESERMGRDHRALAQSRQNGPWNVSAMQRHPALQVTEWLLNAPKQPVNDDGCHWQVPLR